MSEWTHKDEDVLISLAKNSLSVQEILQYLPAYSSGEIASKLNNLRKQRKLPKDYKIRMEQWYEKDLIEYALAGLTPAQISSKFPDTTANVIIGRLSAMKKEGKLPKDYVIRNASADCELVIDDISSPGQDPDLIHIIKELHAGMTRIEKGLSGSSTQYNKNADINDDQDLIHLNNEILDLKEKIEILSNNELTSLKNRISTIENEISTLKLLFDELRKEKGNRYQNLKSSGEEKDETRINAGWHSLINPAVRYTQTEAASLSGISQPTIAMALRRGHMSEDTRPGERNCFILGSELLRWDNERTHKSRKNQKTGRKIINRRR